jgi:hypothetical protein
MYNATIGKYRFELDTDTNRIMVYREGDGVEPIAFISVNSGISEKSFHYEVMSWASETKSI